MAWKGLITEKELHLRAANSSLTGVAQQDPLRSHKRYVRSCRKQLGLPQFIPWVGWPCPIPCHKPSRGPFPQCLCVTFLPNLNSWSSRVESGNTLSNDVFSFFFKEPTGQLSDTRLWEGSRRFPASCQGLTPSFQIQEPSAQLMDGRCDTHTCNIRTPQCCLPIAFTSWLLWPSLFPYKKFTARRCFQE